MVRVEAHRSPETVPEWARKQRRLVDLLNGVPDPFLDRYFEDGEPYWPPEGHVGVDGGDDLYEGLRNWPLAYAVGADDAFLDGAKAAFEGIVERLGSTETPFGHPMAVDEYEQSRDWFHQGEGNVLLYNLCFADPTDRQFRDRAERFAGFYLPDADTGNYDPDRNIVRAPMTGSMGHVYCDLGAFTEHHPYDHRYRWPKWGFPFDDVAGIDSVADAMDPDNREKLLDALEDRVERGDTPLNLGIAALMANAYMLSGDEAYREWVRTYVDGWRERTRENDGVVPDNVGLSGEVGEYTGAWYGGFYGWSWTGWTTLGPLIAVGATTATLLDGDDSRLDFLRSTLDELTDHAISRGAGDGQRLFVPHKYGDAILEHRGPNSALRGPDGSIRQEDGWYEFRPLNHQSVPANLWIVSRDPWDADRLQRLDPNGAPPRQTVRLDNRNKAVGGHDHAWLSYLDGAYPEYPEEILEADADHVRRRAVAVGDDERSPDEFDENYLARANPVAVESLLQLTMGAPQQVYNGGLLHATVRHFDPVRERPGLPPDVAALLETVDPEETRLSLVNTGTTDRDLTVQAGAYAEHRFTSVARETDGSEHTVDAPTVELSLPAGTAIDLDLEWERLANDPTYAFPWDREARKT